MRINSTGKIIFGLALAFLGGLSILYGADPRTPMDVNLIIDGSEAVMGFKDEIVTWVSHSLIDQILTEGDRITIWNAGAAARVVYSDRIKSASDRDAVRKSLLEISGSGNSADFSGALREAASMQQGSVSSYTLLISVSPAALSSVLSGPQASLLRFSRVEEFSGWRALVIGLNIDAKVRRAAASYFGP